MTVIRHHFTNYNDALDWLGDRVENKNISSAFKAKLPFNILKTEIEKDIPRAKFYPDNGGIEKVRAFFSGWRNKRENFCYTQGDMFGGIFAQTMWMHVYLQEKGEEPESFDNHSSLQ